MNHDGLLHTEGDGTANILEHLGAGKEILEVLRVQTSSDGGINGVVASAEQANIVAHKHGAAIVLLEARLLGFEFEHLAQHRVTLDQFGVVHHRCVAFHKRLFEGHLADQFQILARQILLAAHNGAEGHTLELVDGRAVHHHLVHGCAIARVGQAREEAAIGFEDAVFLAAVLDIKRHFGIMERQVEETVQKGVGLQEADGVVGGYGARGRFGGERIVSQLLNFLEVASEHAVLHSARQYLVLAFTECVGCQARKGQNNDERAPGQATPVMAAMLRRRLRTRRGLLLLQMEQGAANTSQDESREGQ